MKDLLNTYSESEVAAYDQARKDVFLELLHESQTHYTAAINHQSKASRHGLRRTLRDVAHVVSEVVEDSATALASATDTVARAEEKLELLRQAENLHYEQSPDRSEFVLKGRLPDGTVISMSREWEKKGSDSATEQFVGGNYQNLIRLPGQAFASAMTPDQIIMYKRLIPYASAITSGAKSRAGITNSALPLRSHAFVNR